MCVSYGSNGISDDWCGSHFYIFIALVVYQIPVPGKRYIMKSDKPKTHSAFTNSRASSTLVLNKYTILAAFNLNV